MSRTRRSVKVTPTQAKVLEELLGSQTAPTHSRFHGESLREQAPHASQDRAGEAIAPTVESWPDPALQWPGAAKHRLEHPIRCAGCDGETLDLLQALDGLKVGPPRCPRCYAQELPASRRRGPAARRALET